MERGDVPEGVVMADSPNFVTNAQLFQAFMGSQHSRNMMVHSLEAKEFDEWTTPPQRLALKKVLCGETVTRGEKKLVDAVFDHLAYSRNKKLHPDATEKEIRDASAAPEVTDFAKGGKAQHAAGVSVQNATKKQIITNEEDPIKLFLRFFIEILEKNAPEITNKWLSACNSIVYQQGANMQKLSYIRMGSLRSAFDVTYFLGHLKRSIEEEGALSYDPVTKILKFKFVIHLNANAVFLAHNAGAVKLPSPEFLAIRRPYFYKWASGGFPYPASGTQTAVQTLKESSGGGWHKVRTSSRSKKLTFNFNSKGDLGAGGKAESNDFFMKYLAFGANYSGGLAKGRGGAKSRMLWYRSTNNRVLPRNKKKPINMIDRFLRNLGLERTNPNIDSHTGVIPVKLIGPGKGLFGEYLEKTAKIIYDLIEGGSRITPSAANAASIRKNNQAIAALHKVEDDNKMTDTQKIAAIVKIQTEESAGSLERVAKEKEAFIASLYQELTKVGLSQNDKKNIKEAIRVLEEK